MDRARVDAIYEAACRELAGGGDAGGELGLRSTVVGIEIALDLVGRDPAAADLLREAIAATRYVDQIATTAVRYGAGQIARAIHEAAG